MGNDEDIHRRSMSRGICALNSSQPEAAGDEEQAQIPAIQHSMPSKLHEDPSFQLVRLDVSQCFCEMSRRPACAPVSQLFITVPMCQSSCHTDQWVDMVSTPHALCSSPP
jgi:hypothetical protein